MKNLLKITILLWVALGCSATTGPVSGPLSGIEIDILQQTNQFRESQGLSKLSGHDYLHRLAQKHSQDMARKRVAFGHAGFEKRNTDAMRNIKGLYSFAENVAYGNLSAADVITLWKNSSGHRKNMLGNYNLMGIGVAKAADGTLFFTQIFAQRRGG